MDVGVEEACYYDEDAYALTRLWRIAESRGVEAFNPFADIIDYFSDEQPTDIIVAHCLCAGQPQNQVKRLVRLFDRQQQSDMLSLGYDCVPLNSLPMMLFDANGTKYVFLHANGGLATWQQRLGSGSGMTPANTHRLPNMLLPEEKRPRADSPTQRLLLGDILITEFDTTQCAPTSFTSRGFGRWQEIF